MTPIKLCNMVIKYRSSNAAVYESFRTIKLYTWLAPRKRIENEQREKWYY